MEVVWIAVSITMFAGSNSDGTPSMSIVPHRHYQEQAMCEKWRKDRYENPWGPVDPVSGKAVVEYFFDCVPVSPTDERAKNLL